MPFIVWANGCSRRMLKVEVSLWMRNYMWAKILSPKVKPSQDGRDPESSLMLGKERATTQPE